MSTVEIDGDLSVSDLFTDIWGKKYLILAGGAVGFFAGIGFFVLKAPTYVATMTIAAMESQNPTPSGSGSVLASIAGLSGGSTQTRFLQEIEALTSSDVANRLASNPEFMHQVFASQWDGSDWIRPHGIRASITGMLDRAANRPEWQSPSADDLRRLIQSSLVIDKVQPDIFELRFPAKKAKDAVLILRSVQAQADEHLKLMAAAQAKSRIDYIEKRMQALSLNDQRSLLTQEMSNSLTELIHAESGAPYAAKVLDTANAPAAPASPRLSLSALAGAALGLFCGIALAFGKTRIFRRG
jgi:LPS O-antigen subunit length determinant protein (WzzB/FepE family)